MAELDGNVIARTRVDFRDAEDGETEGAPLAPLLPERIGGYRIVRSLGRGGMGTVYEAEQDQPRRTVALKVMHFGVASRSLLHRFESEARVLARLAHPGIAQVYASGTHAANGQFRDVGPVPFFAMEFVAGALPITDYADARGLGVRARVQLFLDVCDAVAYGHEHGVIHRDLKPQNILVDEHGRVKIIDFGVARSSDAGAGRATLQTEVGQILGTVQYMSPEQCEADPERVDARTDVYSLGMVLYELVTGSLPYDVRNSALQDATRTVRECAPLRPSEARRSHPDSAELKGDLETLLLKALEKDPERRFDTARELLEELRRYSRHEAIRARPPSVAYQIRMFARRNRALVSALAGLVVILSASLAVITALYLRTERALSAQQAAERSETEQRRIAEEARRDLDDLRRRIAGLLPAESEPAAAAALADPQELREVEIALERVHLGASGAPELQFAVARSYEVLGDALNLRARRAPVLAGSSVAAWNRSLEIARTAREHAGAASGAAEHVVFCWVDGGAADAGLESAPSAACAAGECSAVLEGRLLAKLARWGEALPDLRHRVLHARALAAARPGQPALARALGEAALELGDAEARSGDFAAAVASLRESLDAASGAGRAGGLLASEAAAKLAAARDDLRAAQAGVCELK